MVSNADSDVFCSTIIATIGRNSLARSVESVLSQDVRASDFEVIVVNDSGRSLTPEDWQHSERVRILNTYRRERCVARNTGAAVARGTYLHFLDDDDWMLPGAFRVLWAIARASKASLIYGKTRFVDKEGALLSESLIDVDGDALVQVMAAGAWLPIQASLIKTRDFFQVGGLDYRFAICEDKDLVRRIALIGDLAHTAVPVLCALINRETSTSPYEKSLYYNQWSRDNVLTEKRSFARMLASAKTPFWRGRLIRVYLTGISWNLRKKNPGRVMRRMGEAVLSFLLSLPFIFSIDFLHGIFWSNDRYL